MGRIQLYCPSTRRTIDGFVVGAFQTLDQVLQGVRLALDIKHATLYTIDAKFISEPSALQEDQRVLVAMTENEVMLPDAPPDWVLYDGEEGDDIDPDIDGFGQEWDDLCDHDKCLHIISLNEQKPTTRNKLRITRPYKSVQADINALDSVSQSTLSTAENEKNIKQRWGISVEHFLPTSMKPASARPGSKSCDSSTLVALSVLSSFTHGQSRLALEVLEEAIALRTQEDQGDDKDPALRKEDVLNTIAIVYERADVLPTKVTKAKSGKAKERGKRRASKGKKKVGALEG